MTKNINFHSRMTASALAIGATLAFGPAARADIVHNDDVIILFSLCVGTDCVNGESFGFDTIRLKENNLRIKFEDTSNSGSFPSTDWQLTANDSTNGGANKFSIDDITGGKTPFTITAGAPTNSLFVNSSGNVGFGTSTPGVELHVKDGDTPTLRLEQDGSSGFAPQTWDVAGNESSFFIRDVTNGSKLPIRIRPSAPNSSIDIAANGYVGLGTASPSDNLHVRASSGNATMRLSTPDAPYDVKFNLNATSDTFRISFEDGGGAEFILDDSGNLTLQGGLVTGTVGSCTVASPCDRVFSPDYNIPTIAQHAEEMWTNQFLPEVGPTKAGEPLNVTVKLTRMLNELEKAHIYIEQLDKRVASLEKSGVE